MADKRKLKKGRDYDGWVFKWETFEDGSPCNVSDMAFTFQTRRADVRRGVSEATKQWSRRHGGHLVRVQLVEVKP